MENSEHIPENENENENENINTINEDFNYDETVEIIDQIHGSVNEGTIVSIRGDILIIYNKETKKEERYNKEDNIVIKCWHFGRPFQIFNRVELEIPEKNYWVIGMITDINKEKELLCIKYTDKNSEIKEEYINIHSQRISPIGYHTTKTGTGNLLSVDEINKKLFKNRKFITLSKDQEENFRNTIEKSHFFIKEMKGDGNCMFRAFADQIYGDEEYHEIIREKCMDYLQVEKKFFSQFIEDGEKEFDNYVNMKRKLGVWGDDVELQALSEIYNRPIEIYSGSDKPLKTFHENKNDFNLKNKDNKNSKIQPIRISYHGNKHYNSIIPSKYNIEVWTNYKDSMLKEKPGEYETRFIENKKLEKLNNKKEEEKIDESRKNFMEKKDKYLDDMLLDLLLNEEGKNDKSLMEQSKLEYKQEEDELLKKVINESIKENNNKKSTLNEMDYYSNPVIQSALEFGFPLEDAIMAWTIYGDNKDLVLQYLFSTQTLQ